MSMRLHTHWPSDLMHINSWGHILWICYSNLLIFCALLPQVGMQNSSLGVVLASSHFTSPLVSLPCAMSAVIMNIMGSTLGFIWRYVDPSDPPGSVSSDGDNSE